MTDASIHEPGDVVYGADPFKGATAARPWLVISNHDGRPFHGEQYIGVTLTTKSWMEGLIALEEQDWVYGGTPKPSRIVPWGVQSISKTDIDRWQGRLRDAVLETAVEELIGELSGARSERCVV